MFIYVPAILAFAVSAVASPPDLAGALPMRDGGLCTLGTREQAVFDDLLHPRPKLTPVPVRFARRDVKLSSGATERVERSTFIGPVRWAGLPLAAAEVRVVQNPESEGVIEEALVFAVSPARLQRTLASRGVGIPLAPAFKSVPLDESNHEASIAREPEGSALTCSWDG